MYFLAYVLHNVCGPHYCPWKVVKVGYFGWFRLYLYAKRKSLLNEVRLWRVLINFNLKLNYTNSQLENQIQLLLGRLRNYNVRVLMIFWFFRFIISIDIVVYSLYAYVYRSDFKLWSHAKIITYLIFEFVFFLLEFNRLLLYFRSFVGCHCISLPA